MRFTEDEIDRIKRTRSVLEFLDSPRKAGRCYRARCPLPGHAERTPSFYCYPDGGFYCFGCARGGKDVIRFAAHYWGLSWPQDFPLALEKLGARSEGLGGADSFLPPTITAPVQRQEAVPTLPDAVALAVYGVAAALWQRHLWAPTGADALAYLRGRGLPDALLRREGVGFSTGTLADELDRCGLSRETAQQLGLLRPTGQETFTGRVVLWEWRRLGGTWTPVWATARLCGSGATWDEAPKYLNVRGERLLGGLERALGAREVALVEGAFDRLALLSFGEAAVFLGSNDPPEGVLGEVRRLARRAVLYLVRDRDRAGRRGAWATLYKLRLPPAARVVVVDLPPGVKDPGELAARPDGAALYREAKRQGRLIDLARLRRRCERCHEIVEQHRSSRSAHGTGDRVSSTAGVAW